MALNYQAMKQAVKTVIKAGNVPNLVGEAGIGKSTLVSEVAEELGAKLFTTVVSLVEKGDLAIPVPPLRDEAFIKTTQYGELANVQYGYSETLIQIIQQAESHPEQPIIWFLDEFNRGTVAVQSELMNLVLQRQINSLLLPRQVRIVIAENPDDSMSGFADTEYAVTPADAAIKDRTVRLVMEASLTDWLQWASTTENGQPRIHPLVQEYLQAYPESLTGPRNEDLYPTPRAWERVSKNLSELLQLEQSLQEQLMPDVFSGDLGAEVGVAFTQFVLDNGNQLTADDLLTDQGTKQFEQLAEPDRVQLLNQFVSDQFTKLPEPAVLKHLLAALQVVSPDGQYAVVQQFAKLSHQNPTVLEKFYQQAQQDSLTAEFYQLLQRIAVM
ncbi:ATP-binding protein [Limosilactobacillus caecicola]|uniref:ATP-binding protein n=1 Tax=Limosilactobacillus caecicola TaxID=2941332 RepID=UPI002041CC57|nr:ATP-binding protein [Limosilactobacillus caecicola]